MGVQTFSQFKKELEARGFRIKFGMPGRGRFNLAIDMSSIIYERFKGDFPEERRLELIYSDVMAMIEVTAPAQVFLCTDGPQPKQKLQTQRRRFAGKSRFVIKSSLETVFGYLARKGMPPNLRNVKVFFEYNQPGEGEMKAIAFNLFDDPSLPKLVFSKDNDVHMVLGLCSARSLERSEFSKENSRSLEKFSEEGGKRDSHHDATDTHHDLSVTDRQASRLGKENFCQVATDRQASRLGRENFCQVESRYWFSPHDVFKIEWNAPGGRYEIVDVWRELGCSRWFACLAATCIFGNDYVHGVWSGTQRQWSHVLERLLKLDLSERGLDPARLDLGRDVERAIALVAELCDKPSSFEERADLSNATVEAYVEKIKWWLSYYRNVYVCYTDDQLGEDGSPISAEMPMVCLSLVEFRSLKNKLREKDKL